MSTTRLARRPTPVQSTGTDLATWGPVHLDVTDGPQALGFWRDLIGLRLLAEDEGTLRLGVDDAELLVLHPGATRRVPRGHAGLYHLAIHLPSEAEFARLLARLFTARYPNSPTDHIMHWATYLDDPDGIGLEVSFETFDRFGAYDLAAGQPYVIDSDGKRRHVVSPLDLDEVFGHLSDENLDLPLAAGARIGHLHLHVSELESAVSFYEALGFRLNAELMGMAELNLGGSFPHRLALNIWQGVGAPPRPADAAGLRQADLRVASPEELKATIDRARALGAATEERDGGVRVADPSGNRIYLTAAQPR
ncbi:MAG TPA: VOC family protein [Solirubrobacteraceae bacterium]|nr:VOC family protein [Solirubrobacteraceae bacterium]